MSQCVSRRRAHQQPPPLARSGSTPERDAPFRPLGWAVLLDLPKSDEPRDLDWSTRPQVLQWRMLTTGPTGLIRAPLVKTRTTAHTLTRVCVASVSDCVRVDADCFRHAYGAPPARPAGNGSRHVHVSRVRSTHVGRRKRPSVVRAHCSQTHAHVVRCPTRPGVGWLTHVPKLGYGLRYDSGGAHVVRWRVRTQDTCARVAAAHPRSEKNGAHRPLEPRKSNGGFPLARPTRRAAPTTARKRCACAWSRVTHTRLRGARGGGHQADYKVRSALTDAPSAARPQKTKGYAPVECGGKGPGVGGLGDAGCGAPPRTWHRSGYRTGRPGYERSHASAHTSRRMR